MAVALSAQSTSFTTVTAPASPTTDTKITVGASDSILVVTVTTQISGATGFAANWDSTGTNQSMTLVSSIVGTNQACYIFALVNPTAGNKTLSLTWSSTFQELHIYNYSFTGSITSSVAAAVPHQATNSGAGTPLTISLTSATGDYTVGCAQNDGTISSFSGNSPNGYVQNTGPDIASTAGSQTGAATVTYSLSSGGGFSESQIAGIDIAAAGAADLFEDTQSIVVLRGLSDWYA